VTDLQIQPSAEKGQADWQLQRLGLVTQELTQIRIAVFEQLLVVSDDPFCSGRCIVQTMTDSTWLLQQHSVCNQLAQYLSECVSSTILL